MASDQLSITYFEPINQPVNKPINEPATPDVVLTTTQSDTILPTTEVPQRRKRKAKQSPVIHVFPEYSGGSFEDHQIYDYLKQVWDKHHKSWDANMINDFQGFVPKAKFTPATHILSSHYVGRHARKNGATLAHFIVLNAMFGKKAVRSQRWWPDFEAAHPRVDKEWESGPFYGARGSALSSPELTTPEPRTEERPAQSQPHSQSQSRSRFPSPSPSIAASQSEQLRETTTSEEASNDRAATNLMTDVKELLDAHLQNSHQGILQLEQVTAHQDKTEQEMKEMKHQVMELKQEMRGEFAKLSSVLEKLMGHVQTTVAGRPREVGFTAPPSLNFVGTQFSWNFQK